MRQKITGARRMVLVVVHMSDFRIVVSLLRDDLCCFRIISQLRSALNNGGVTTLDFTSPPLVDVIVTAMTMQFDGSSYDITIEFVLYDL